MQHRSISLVLAVLVGGCADDAASDGSGGGGSSTGDWSGSTASSSSASSSSSTSSSTSASASTTSSTSAATSSSSSGTGGGDATPPTVLSVTPAEGAAAVHSLAKVTVTFSEEMAPSTVTSTTSTTCSGSVQVSNDDFTTCVPMTGAATTNDDVTFTLVPAEKFTSLDQYRVRVTAAATDAAGNALSPAFQSTTGFQIGFWHTVTIDGANDFGPTDAFATSTAGTQLYVTHDDESVFVGLSSPDIAPQSPGNKFVYFLFSTDPALSTGNALSSDGKAKFGAGKAMTWHYKERIAGGTYSEFRVGDASGWSTDWGSANKESNVGTGFLEARIGLSEFGGASTLAVTAYTVDYDGDGGSGWLYNMFAGATDGSGAEPRDVARHVALTLPTALVPNDASHLASF